MMKKMGWIGMLVLGLLLAGCTNKNDPKAVARAFQKKIMNSGNAKKEGACVEYGYTIFADLQFVGIEITDKAAEIEGNRATVGSIIKYKISNIRMSGRKLPPNLEKEVSFPKTIRLSRYDDGWRVENRDFGGDIFDDFRSFGLRN